MKLLQKTIRNYLVYSVFIVLIAVPVFYIAMQRIVRHDIDEALKTSREKIISTISHALKDHTLEELHYIDDDIIIKPAAKLLQKDFFTTRNIFDTLSQEIVPHRILTSGFMAGGNAYTLSIDKSLVDDEDLIESIVKVQSLLLLVLLAGFFLINRQLSKRVMQPFYHTLAILQKYKVETHKPLILPHSTIDEFNELNRSLQELTARSYTSYIGQKEFTENASHEMQTPLAIFQSKLELLMQTSPLNQEQGLLMEQLDNATQRMKRLNKSLVLFTKIENSQFSQKESVSLKSCIETFMQVYQPYIDQKKIIVSYEHGNDTLLEANNVLLEILISNLLGNAIRHNHTDGMIDIRLNDKELVICNSGKLHPLDTEKIFKRFQKDSSDDDSIGLGLAMVKNICLLLNAGVTYSYTNELHQFTLQFPAK